MGVLEGFGRRVGSATRWIVLSAPKLVWVVVAAGAALRLARYLDDRSLWLDESLLALNVVTKSMGELLASLDYVQSAPPGFLVVEKGSTYVFGTSELALRFVPLLASLAGLVLFALVARRLLTSGFALLAVAIFAVIEPLLYQSSEAKPYSSDVAVALLVVWLTLRVLDATERRVTVRAVLTYALVGVGALTMSYPSVFVVASAAAALFLMTLRSSTHVPLWLIAALSALWAGAFLIVYWTSSETIASVGGQVFSRGGRPTVDEVARSFWYTLADPGGFTGVSHGIAALLIIVGCASFAVRGRPERLALVAGPPALAIVAAFSNRYPLGDRFSLFLVPFFSILVAAGLEETARLLGGSTRRALVVSAAAVVLLTLPIRDALVHISDPPRREDVRPLLQRIVRGWQPGDSVYVFRNAQYAFRYYGECGCGLAYPFPLKEPTGDADNDGLQAALVTNAPSLVIGIPDDAKRRTGNLKLLEGRSRVWALFSHAGVGHADRREEDRLLTRLDEHGRRLGSWREPGATLYLYRGDG